MGPSRESRPEETSVHRVVEKACNGFSVAKMFAEDLSHRLLVEVGIPNAFGVNHHVRSVPALAQTAGQGHPHLSLGLLVFQAFLKGMQGVLGALLAAGRSGTHKEMRVRKHKPPNQGRASVDDLSPPP